MHGAAGAVAVFAAVVLPWTTWLRFAAPTPEAAAEATPLFLFTLAALLVGAVLLVRAGDPFLGAFVALAALLTLRTPTAWALECAQWIAFGSLLLSAVRALPRAWHPTVVGALALGSVLQLVYCLHRALGADVLWLGLAPAAHLHDNTMIGTLGNENHVGALLALVIPLASPWLWPLLLAGLVLTKSGVALAAAGVGLLVRYRSWRVAAVLVVAAAALLLVRGPSLISAKVRVKIWALGLWDLGQRPLDALIGAGPGSWYERVPTLQRRFWISGNEWFGHAHSEPVQLVYEFGTVGFACLIGWLLHHRALWRGRYAGACAALVIVSLGSFPFHVAPLAMVALVILGLATPTEIA